MQIYKKQLPEDKKSEDWVDNYRPSENWLNLNEFGNDANSEAQKFLQAFINAKELDDSEEEQYELQKFCKDVVEQTKKFKDWNIFKEHVLQNLVRRTVANVIVGSNAQEKQTIISTNHRYYNEISGKNISEEAFKDLCAQYQFKELKADYLADENKLANLQIHYEDKRGQFLDTNTFPTLQQRITYNSYKDLLPESIRNACKNADELEQAFILYKGISPYIASNEDGQPFKVSNAFNAPSQAGVSRTKAVKINFRYFIKDYTAIHDKETCERFIKKEIKRNRLDNTEEAKEAFVRYKKAVHAETKKEFEKITKSNVSWRDWLSSNYLNVNVDDEIKKCMQERIEKNREKANALSLNPRFISQRVNNLRGNKDVPKPSFSHQRFGVSKEDQKLLSDIQSVNEEVDRLTHSAQASTKTLQNTLEENRSLVKNFEKKSEIDDCMKNFEKRPKNQKEHVPVVQIDLSATSSTSHSKSKLSPSFFSASTTAISSPNGSAKCGVSRNYNSSVIDQMTFGKAESSTSIPSQMTFRPNTQENRVKNIIAQREKMQKEFSDKYRERAQERNIYQSVTLVPNRAKFLTKPQFGPKLMQAPKLLQR